MNNKNRVTHKRPRWHLLYFVLAAFDLATISVSLYLNHSLMDIYVDSVQTNRQWADRLGSYAALGALASETNAPGNDVFDTRDVPGESAKLNERLALFNEKLALARRDLQENVSPQLAQSLLDNLDAIQLAMDNMVEEAERIFEFFRHDQAEEAGRRMATMDRKNARVAAEIVRMGEQVRLIQRTHFDQELATASSLRIVEYAIATLIILMVVCVTVYGHKVSQRVKQTDQELHDYAKALEDASKEAQAASEAKSAFLANMSHEIRTPMTAILGFGDLLLDPEATDQDKTNAINTIRNNGHHLLSLINDILDLSKIESGKFELEQTPCDTRAIMRDVADLLDHRAKEKGLSIKIIIQGQIPATILTDPTRLKQALVNLAGNAVKFTKQGSVTIAARCQPDERRITFDVIDTGIGIARDKIKVIFEPFSQADVSTTRHFGGTGLGLTITHKIAQLLGGGIHIESQVGQGSTFALTVATGPLEGVQWVSASDPNPTARPTPHDQVHAPPKIQGHILLVEDGLDNQRLIGFILRKAGATVDIADNGQIGLEKVIDAWQNNQPYDVVLSDMQMPVMDGYRMAQTLRTKGYPWQIIALTAHAMKGDIDKCLAAGCDHYLSKPVDRNLLIREVAVRLGQPSHHPVLTTDKAIAGVTRHTDPFAQMESSDL